MLQHPTLLRQDRMIGRSMTSYDDCKAASQLLTAQVSQTHPDIKQMLARARGCNVCILVYCTVLPLCLPCIAIHCRPCSTNSWRVFHSCAAHATTNALSAYQKYAGVSSPAARREMGDANDASWLVNMHVWPSLSMLICLTAASMGRQLCSLARFNNALCLLCVLCMQKSTSAAAIVGSIDCEAACGLSLFTCSVHCVWCVVKIWLSQVVLSTQAKRGFVSGSCCSSCQAANSAVV